MGEAPYELLNRHRDEIFGAIPVLQTLTIDIPEMKKDLWEHTMKVCNESSCNQVVRWAALFHDIGKPVVYGLSKGSTFANHAEVGAEEWRLHSKRVQSVLSDEDITRVETLIRLHMRIEQYRQNWGNKAVSKLVSEYNGDIDLGINLARADGWSYYLSDHLERRLCHIR